MAPLPVSERGNHYILVVTDLFTKWVEAFPISNTLSTTLATVLVDEVICHYGIPSYLHSDQGANLCSEVVSCLCKLLNIHKTRTSVHKQLSLFYPRWYKLISRIGMYNFQRHYLHIVAPYMSPLGSLLITSILADRPAYQSMCCWAVPLWLIVVLPIAILPL